ncbi:MAG: Hint domain-containing protein [Rhodobacteraceae bacterium]|nr:Hint domain-containing protein [Paracoccaceae bacterium]
MKMTMGAVSPCFTPGTMIATGKGEVAIEDIKTGDKIVTRDNGLQPVAWIGQRTLSWKELTRAPHLLPIVFRAGALDGGNRPDRDIYLSPEHRVLVDHRAVMRDTGKGEVLAAAKDLIDHRLVKPVQPLRVCYLHLLFERHQVILSNGLWTESFCPSDSVMAALCNAQRLEVLDLFPEAQSLGRAARPVRPVAQVRRGRR